LPNYRLRGGRRFDGDRHSLSVHSTDGAALMLVRAPEICEARRKGQYSCPL
jgi:hypothetical protein